MKIRNRQAEAVPSSLTLDQFGQAMAQLDLAAVPPEKRAGAIMDHLARVMSDTISDPVTAYEIKVARRLLRLKRLGLSTPQALAAIGADQTHTPQSASGLPTPKAD